MITEPCSRRRRCMRSYQARRDASARPAPRAPGRLGGGSAGQHRGGTLRLRPHGHLRGSVANPGVAVSERGAARTSRAHPVSISRDHEPAHPSLSTPTQTCLLPSGAVASIRVPLTMPLKRFPPATKESSAPFSRPSVIGVCVPSADILPVTIW